METTLGPTTERLPVRRSRNGGPPSSGGVPPALVIAIAFVVGVLAARMLDWRTHAHPRD